MAEALSALLIDDDELVVTSFSRQLQSRGFAVTHSAGDAVGVRAALASGRPFDLVVLDLLLPGTDAVELLREHAARLRACPLILISSQDERLLRSVAVLAGEHRLRVLGAMRKPLRAEGLDRLLAQLSPASADQRAPLPSAGDLAAALQRGEIELHAQPKLRATDGQPSGVELLARWQTAPRGPVSAVDLLRLAENSRLEANLNDYVLARAMRTSAELGQAGLFVPIAVNLGAEALRRTDLPNQIERMLQVAGLSSAMLTVEVQESSILDELAVLDVLTRLRLRGVRVALDRFGSGLGSLVRLQRLPLNEIKIAPSFVRAISGSETAAALVEQIVNIGKALALETTAVGVEDEAQAAALRSMGCERLQGRHLAAPMPLAELFEWWPAHARATSGIAA